MRPGAGIDFAAGRRPTLPRNPHPLPRPALARPHRRRARPATHPARVHLPGQSGRAWPGDSGLRIGHTLLSAGLAERLAGVAVDKDERAMEKASDHVPVVVEIG